MLEQAQADTEDIPATPVDSPLARVHKYIFSPGDLIAGRYRVLRKVAKGGMGEVYEVQDLELHSRVALKVISLKSAAKPNSAEMFRREILLARQVTHPNVCRIYDIGHHEHADHGDLMFLTMEFLEGTTLADRVRTQGPLSKEEALPLIQTNDPRVGSGPSAQHCSPGLQEWQRHPLRSQRSVRFGPIERAVGRTSVELFAA